MKKKLFAGIMITLFLVTTTLSTIPLASPSPGTYKIGLVGPMGWIQWDGIKEGALIARELINDAGGMGGVDTLEFVEIDSHAVPTPQPDLGRRDLLAALDANPDMDIIIGGFRSECVIPMREAAMDYAAANGRPIWLIAGAATDGLLKVDEDYERYKYMFRTTPMAVGSLFTQLLAMMSSLIIPKIEYAKGTGLLSANIYIVGEQLVWCDSAVATLEAVIPLSPAFGGLGRNHVGTARPSAVETDFTDIFTDIEAQDTDIIIHIFSAVAGAAFIRQWGELGISAVPVGINVESQMEEFYNAIGGLCEYETIMASTGSRTNTNPLSQPLTGPQFWDKTIADYGHTPIYTAWGVYDAIIGLNETYGDYSAHIGNATAMIPIFEDLDRWGILGHFNYTAVGVGNPIVGGEGHDVYVDQYAYTPIWPAGGVRSHLPQWQNGKLQVIWPRGYAVHLGVGPTEPLPFAGKYKLPPQMHVSSTGVSIAESDFAGNVYPTGIPGANFSMPDGWVDSIEMTQLTTLWQMKVPWILLEADMDGDQIITVTDIARVALDFGQST